MKITIITVVFNAEKIIESTLCSVINQTYQDIEYIVIDGSSNDNTIEIIKKHSDRITHFVSEPDYGVYDAMNKAIDFVTGDWILFLNAGDIFNSSKTLSEISADLENNKEAAVLYGDVLVDFNFSINHVQSKSLECIKYSMITNHQACFINAKIHKQIKYDLKYKIASDYDFFFKLFACGYSFTQVNKVISKVQIGGISDKSRDKTYREYLEIRNRYNKNITNYIYFYLGLYYFKISHFLKLLLPNQLNIYIYKMIHKI